MTTYQQQQAYPPPGQAYPPQSYPPPGQAYPPQSYPPQAQTEGYPPATNVAAPPSMGYPTKDGHGYNQNQVPGETKSRGDGFWKGCCAALCCCGILDCCVF